MRRTVLRLIDLAKQGEFKFMLAGIAKRIYSKTQSFGLKRDLSIDFSSPEAKTPISIRPFKIEDQKFFSADLQNDGLIEKAIPTCFVAVDPHGEPCYRQWLMDAKQNDKLQEFWGEAFPILKADEAIAESLFTVPEYRGKGIMPKALGHIALKAKTLGTRYVIAFVEVDNLASLKGCHRAGFSPYILRTETWFFLRRKITFEDVPEIIMDKYKGVVICD